MMDIVDQMEAWRKNARFISEQDFFSRMMFEIITNRNEIERLQRENERYVEAVEKLKVIIDKQSDEIERLLEALQYIAEVNPQCVGEIRVPIEAARDALKEKE